MFKVEKETDVLVIGAGIIGLSCAYEISKTGARVLVVDKDQVGHGCSYGNAGWMTPCFAMPLPQPGMLLKSIKWLINPDSPLYIKPEISITLARWLWSFSRAMNHAHLHASVEALVKISQYSLDGYRELNKKFPDTFGFEQRGLLMVAQTPQGLRDTFMERDLVGRFGVRGQELDPAAIASLEPSLRGKLEGGVHFTDEAHAEPLLTVLALAHAAKANGVEIQTGTEIFDFQIEGDRATRVNTTHGDITAKTIVMATGTWSTRLARRFGLRVPVLGGKGYALIVPKLEVSPQLPIMVLEKKLAITPRATSVRLAGTLELVNQDFSITPRRVKAILRSAQEVLHVPQEPKILELWRGLRPCTPDGVPLIGFTKAVKNIMLVAGHQMLGLQSGLGSGRMAADILSGAETFVNRKLFDPNRF